MTAGCPFCGGETALAASAYPGYRAPTRYDILECHACALSWAIPLRADNELYDAIYVAGPAIPGYERYERYARKVERARDPLAFLASREPNYWAVRRFVSTLLPGARVLDVGTGLGYLAYALARDGFRATGLDVSDEAADRARRRFGDHYAVGNLFDWARERPAEYDAVVMLELIEHVERPREWIEAGLRLLRPGGSLILSTPDRAFYPAGTVWETEAPPVHLWWFSRHAIEVLCEGLGAKLAFADFTECDIEPIPAPTSVVSTRHSPMLDEAWRPLGRWRIALNRIGLLDAAIAAWQVKARILHRLDVARGSALLDPARRETLVAILTKSD